MKAKNLLLIWIFLFILFFVNSCIPRPICGNEVCELGERQTCPKDCEIKQYDLSNYPDMYIKDNAFNGIIVIGGKAPAEDVISASDIAASLKGKFKVPVGAVKLDEEVKTLNQNIISIGSPCDNLITRKISVIERCNFNLEPNEGIIKLYSKNYYYVVVAGYDARGTREAAKVLANWEEHNLEGTEYRVEIKEICNNNNVCEEDIGENQENCDDCYVDGQLNIATLKNNYKVGERVELTDPPAITGAATEYPQQLQNMEDKEALPQFVPGELIVKLKESVTIEKRSTDAKITSNKVSLQNLLDKYKAKETEDVFKSKIRSKMPSAKSHEIGKIKKIKIEKNRTPEALKEFKSDPNIEYAEPNYIAYTSFTPNDPLYSQQWSHQNTKAAIGWDIERGSSDVIIAIIDTGVAYNHEDLSANMLADCTNGCPEGKGYDFVDIDTTEYESDVFELIPGEDYTDIDNNPSDYNGHGTHVAGIAAAVSDNNLGVAGVCYNCKIMPVRAGFSIKIYGVAYGSLEYDDIANAIYYAVDNGAKVISMSFGGRPDELQLKPAIEYAYNKGVVLIAAAGNDYSYNINYPAGYDEVIAVTAADQQDKKPPFSNYGEWTDVAAPGVDILSTVPYDGSISSPSGYEILDGTSMATPYVSGLAGLILSKNPNWGPEQIRRILKQGVDAPAEQNYYIGTGRVNVYKTLQIDSLSDAVAEIDYPKDYDIIQGNINIAGTATGNSYTVYYGKGIYPTNWTEIGSGTTADDEVIAEWNISDILMGQYTLKLEVKDNDEAVEDRVLIYLVVGLQDGWPKKTDSENVASPVCIDINNDGYNEIITASFNGLVYVWDYQGNLLNNWPKDLRTYSLSSPAVADINNDGYNEIIIGSNANRDIFPHSYIYVLDEFANNLNGWPQIIQGQSDFSSPAVADINNDGYNEVIAGETGGYTVGGRCESDSDCPRSDPYGYNISGFQCVYNSCVHYFRNVYVWDFNGNLLPEWPVELDGQVLSTPAIGDINNNGNLEIVIGSSLYGSTAGYVYALDSEGNTLEGWPQKISSLTNYDSNYVPFVYSPILVDINNDNLLEIFIAGDSFYGLYSDGRIIEGWPIDSPISYSSAAGDVNGDGKIEIAFGGGGKIHLVNSNGSPVNGWPIDFTGVPDASPIIGDIDGDNNLEIVANGYGDNHVYAWHSNGSLVQGFPKFMVGAANAGSLLCDLDNDGDVELVTASKDNYVYVWDLNATYNPETMHWSMFMHDPQHTGCYDCESRPKSKLQNTGTSTIKGYLLMKVQKKVNEQWQDIKAIVDESNERAVKAGEYLALDAIWNEISYTTSESGLFKVYAAFRDENGNIIETKSGALSNSWEFEVI